MDKLADLLIKLCTSLIDLISRRRTIRNVRAISIIYQTAKELVFKSMDGETPSPVYQCVIMEAKNGGKHIKPGCRLKTTALYEDYKDGVESFMRYQDITIDGEFVDMLLYCIQHKIKKIRVPELGKGEEGREATLLKLMFSAEEILYSEMHYLYEKNGIIYFCLISTVLENREFQNSYERIAVDLAVNRIRTLIKNV